MQKDFSVGIIPYRRRTKVGFEFLVIQQNDGYWSFPKGHPIGNETNTQTAQRELREETGLSISILHKEFSCKERYVFGRQGEEIEKEVVFYLGLVNKASIMLDSNEVADYAWLPYEKAMLRLTFQESQNALRKTVHYIEKTAL